MARGGKRDGAGRKSTWSSGCKSRDTKLIRVPAYIAERVLEVAKELDEEGCVASSRKVLNLSGVPVRQTGGVISVYLEDLVAKGYDLHPPALAEMVKARTERSRESNRR